VKIIPLNQQDANDLLALITSQALTITANNAARVHQLQAMLSTEPSDVTTLSGATLGELEAELDRRLGNKP
jgi:hypothetical protein